MDAIWFPGDKNEPYFTINFTDQWVETIDDEGAICWFIPGVKQRYGFTPTIRFSSYKVPVSEDEPLTSEEETGVFSSLNTSHSDFAGAGDFKVVDVEKNFCYSTDKNELTVASFMGVAPVEDPLLVLEVEHILDTITQEAQNWGT